MLVSVAWKDEFRLLGCTPTADHFLAMGSGLGTGGGGGRRTVLGAEIMHESVEAEHLHRERVEHY
jgi:hypothetical protein